MTGPPQKNTHAQRIQAQISYEENNKTQKVYMAIIVLFNRLLKRLHISFEGI